MVVLLAIGWDRQGETISLVLINISSLSHCVMAGIVSSVLSTLVVLCVLLLPAVWGKFNFFYN